MSAPTAVLFDAPGPRARRRILVASVVAGLALVAVVIAVLARLAERGQLTEELWGPFLNPGNENFVDVWQLIADGLVVTLRAAAVAVVLSIVLGLVIASLRLSLPRAGRIPVIAVVELLRGLPVIVTLLYVDILMRATGTHQGTEVSLVIGLTLYNMVIISEIVRAGIQSLPRGQVEAGLAIGMTPGQVLRSIQLPQAVRAMLPSLISQLVVILKDTALASIVLATITDLGKSADTIRGFLDNPLQTYFVIGLIYIVINLVLSQIARLVQRRMSTARRPRTAATVGVDEGMQLTGGQNT